MSPGNQNGKNYGGGHTGDGKKARKGIYSTNGVFYRKLSHRYFTPGLEVYYIKTGEKGVIMENNIRGPRKMKKVKFNVNDNILYIPSNLLYPINYSVNEMNKKLNNIKEVRKNKKKVKDYEKMKINNERRKEFREAKKNFRKEVIDDGVYVDYSNSNSEKKYYGSKFAIRKVSDNNLVKELNENILKSVISLDKKINRGSISINDSKLSKQRILDIYMSTGCGSTSSIHNISNKSDYYDIICKYMGREDTIEDNIPKNKKVKSNKIDQYKLDRLLWGLNP